LVWIATSLSACVTQERRDAAAAREAWEDCRRQPPAGDASCDALAAQYQTELDRYFEASKRAWSCDPAHPECPTPR
jgi:hypothetical protein